MKTSRAWFISLMYFSLSTCCSAQVINPISLLALFDGGSITAHDKIFKDFTLLGIDVQDGVVNTAGIGVTPLLDDPLNPGLKFTAASGALQTNSQHPPGTFAKLRFQFTVMTTNGLPLIKDDSLLINGWTFDGNPQGTTHITISETVRDGSRAALATKTVSALIGQIAPDSGNPIHFDQKTFAPHSTLIIEKFIDIEGPGTNDQARLTMFEQRFSQVPEPSSLMLAGILAACGIAWGSWRRH